MTFDPGPEWREVARPVAAAAPEAVTWRGPKNGDRPRIRAWVPKTMTAEEMGLPKYGSGQPRVIPLEVEEDNR